MSFLTPFFSIDLLFQNYVSPNIFITSQQVTTPTHFATWNHSSGLVPAPPVSGLHSGPLRVSAFCVCSLFSFYLLFLFGGCSFHLGVWSIVCLSFQFVSCFLFPFFCLFPDFFFFWNFLVTPFSTLLSFHSFLFPLIC